MIRTFLAAGAAVFTLAAAAAADIPPFNPPPEPIAPAGTTIGPDEVRFTPPGGPEIDSGRFAAVRSLNGECRPRSSPRPCSRRLPAAWA